MAINEIHENDTVTFEVEVRDNSNTIVDISTAATGTMDFIFVKPDDTVVVKGGTLSNDGKDGLMKYTANDLLTPKGIWHYQIDLVKADGHWASDIVKFRVYRNLR